MDDVWVFNGANSTFPAGIFSSRAKAEFWISQHLLNGTLTRYPVDTSAYDWAIAKGVFAPKQEHQLSAGFIQRFTSASQEHYHYESGKCVS